VTADPSETPVATAGAGTDDLTLDETVAAADVPPELVAKSLGQYLRASLLQVRSGNSGVLPVILGLVVVAIAFQIANSKFLSAQNLVNLFEQSTIYMLLAIAEIFALLLGEIDLSVGLIMGLGSVVVETEGLVKGFGDRVLFDGLSFSLPRNGLVGVIGPNGVGKTTLFKMIVGEEKPDSGLIRVGDTVKISYSDQNRDRIDPNKNVWQAISDGETFIRVGNVEFPSRAYVAAFGFKGSDQQKPAGVMSGGERNRMNLALTLKQGGNLLLLDEPTNDLDVETLGSLENALLEFPGCAVITSHDRWFLDRIATHILAWEGGANWFWFEGNFEAYEKNKIERLGAEAARPHRVTYRKLTRG